jgi:hypothetical protein
MATFEIQGRDLALVFTPLEILGGLRAGARIPLDQVQSVEVVQDPWSILEGLRVGTGIPWVIVLGTMVRSGPNDVVAVYKQRPAVVVNFRPGALYHRFIATVPEPDRVAAELSDRISSAPR